MIGFDRLAENLSLTQEMILANKCWHGKGVNRVNSEKQMQGFSRGAVLGLYFSELDLLWDDKSLEKVFHLLRENLKRGGERKCHIAGT